MTRSFRMSSDTPYLTCDRCDKAQNLPLDQARAAGWSIGICFDYCPSCATTTGGTH